MVILKSHNSLFLLSEAGVPEILFIPRVTPLGWMTLDVWFSPKDSRNCDPLHVFKVHLEQWFQRSYCNGLKAESGILIEEFWGIQYSCTLPNCRSCRWCCGLLHRSCLQSYDSNMCLKRGVRQGLCAHCHCWMRWSIPSLPSLCFAIWGTIYLQIWRFGKKWLQQSKHASCFQATKSSVPGAVFFLSCSMIAIAYLFTFWVTIMLKGRRLSQVIETESTEQNLKVGEDIRREEILTSHGYLASSI